MSKLTIAYITCRHEPKFEWFVDSLANQLDGNPLPPIILVDGLYDTRRFPSFVQHVPVKPTIWQGKHRITREAWWAKSASLNTAICLCQTEFICFIDDRCVLGPQWLESVLRAMQSGKAVCGAYEKRVNMQVENGKIVHHGEVIGTDHRLRKQSHHMIFGDSWFGCCNVLPLEWCLKVGGYPENYCDGMRYEDTTFGGLLVNNDCPLAYDRKMMVIQDRTQGQIGPDIRGMDKGQSPMDKSHKLIEMFDGKKTSMNSFDIRAMRDSVLAGNPFPMPSASHLDWYDNQPISEMI